MIPWWWSVLLAAVGVFGLWLAGSKNQWGWFINLCAQFLWIVYAYVTQQWGFYLSALAYGTVYLRNWLEWRRDHRLSKLGHPTQEAPNDPRG